MLSRNYLRQRLKLKFLSTKSLRLLPFLGSKTDLDGLISATVGQIKEANVMTSSLIEDALRELQIQDWIYKGEDGFFYSHFHTTSTADNHHFHYINLYKFFQSESFKSMYKRSLNFLYYILTAKLPGTLHTVAIEHLYANKSNEKNVILDYFISFEDMMKHLIQLIEYGFFEVRLGKNKQFITKDTSNIKEKIYQYAGKVGKRKHRITGIEEKHKLIHIRIAPHLVTKEEICDIYDVTRLSTLQDLKSIAAEYGCSLEFFEKAALKEVHMTKKKLYDTFGNLGIQLYRESLRDFFTYRSHAFQELMEKEEFGRTIKNFYVMPRIQNKLKSFFEKAQQECVTTTERFPYESINQNRSKEIFEQSKPYITYFNEDAPLESLVTLDQELDNQFKTIYKDLYQNDQTWSLFKNKVSQMNLDEIKNEPDKTKQKSSANKKYSQKHDSKKKHPITTISDEYSLIFAKLEEKHKEKYEEKLQHKEKADWMKHY